MFLEVIIVSDIYVHHIVSHIVTVFASKQSQNERKVMPTFPSYNNAIYANLTLTFIQLWIVTPCFC